MDYSEYSKVIAFDQLPNPDETWILGEKIGEGTYGEVYAAENRHTGRGNFNYIDGRCCFLKYHLRSGHISGVLALCIAFRVL